MVNAEACALVAKNARVNSDFHDQSIWMTTYIYADMQVPYQLPQEFSCDTRACLAGITAMLFAPEGTRYDPYNETLLLPDGSRRQIWNWAREELDLSYKHAQAIFYITSTNELAIRRLEYMAANPEATVEELKENVPARDCWSM